jgi:integrase
MKKEPIRKTFPKIRVVVVNGEKLFQVDARRTNTGGKREYFTKQHEAEKRANAIAADYMATGTEGLAFSADLRFMATAGAAMLEPYGATILQACEHYRDLLKSRKEAQASALVPFLAEQWSKDKASGKLKKLRPRTLKDIAQTKDILVTAFAGVRILDLTATKIESYLDKQPVGLQRKYNLCSLFSQFFNWCIAKDYITKNPTEKIEIEVGGRDVAIFKPSEAEHILEVCEKRFPAYVHYHAISLFAGLRPEECQALKWENIHLEEKTIHVLAETSKIKEARNVHIEDVLALWLEKYMPEEPKGFVTPQVNFKKYTLQIHMAAGYQGTRVNKVNGQLIYTKVNPDASLWPQDVMRHCYGTYWLAKHGNRAQLAEYMGNSLQIIKKHYKKVVSKSQAEAYWKLRPDRKPELHLSREEIRAARARRVAAAVATEAPPEV